MHHLAIMNPRWHLIDKILSGEKKIESRWYKHRIAPWKRVAAGDTVFFKDAGKPVIAKASVEGVLFQEINTVADGIKLASRFKSGLCFTTDAFTNTTWLRGKRYAILIFLKNPKQLPPFNIDKSGYGNACAWITVPNIETITGSKS